jgi:hypothetical protein
VRFLSVSWLTIAEKFFCSRGKIPPRPDTQVQRDELLPLDLGMKLFFAWKKSLAQILKESLSPISPRFRMSY